MPVESFIEAIVYSAGNFGMTASDSSREVKVETYGCVSEISRNRIGLRLNEIKRIEEVSF